MNIRRISHWFLGMILASGFCHAQTVLEVEGNLRVKDDPATTGVTEGFILADNGIMLGTSFAPSDSDLPGGGNIALGLAQGSYNLRDTRNSILLGTDAYIFNSQNSLNLGSTYGIHNSSSSMVLGEGEVTDSSASISVGRSYVYNSQNSFTLGAGYITDSKQSLTIDGCIMSSEKSFFIGDTPGPFSSIYFSKYIIGVGEADSYLSEKLFMIGRTSAYKLKYGILAGDLLSVHGNTDNGAPHSEHVYVFGSDLYLDTYDRYFRSTNIASIVSFGHSNAPMRNNTYMMGEGLAVKSRYSFTVGRYNDPIVDDSNMTDFSVLSGGDPVFMVGNGTSDAQRSNAIEVKRNGDTNVSGHFEAETLKTRQAAGGIDMGRFGRGTSR